MRWNVLGFVCLAGCLAGGDGSSTALTGAETERCAVDVSAWVVVSDGVETNLAGVVPTRSYLVISAGASRAEFEARWGELDPSAAFYEGSVAMGGSFALVGSEVLDGPTFTADRHTNQTRRGNSPAERARSWHSRSPADATPGYGRLSGPHIRISEIADVGEGEPEELAYVEIYTGGFVDGCDEPDPEPEPDPATSCTSDADCVGHPDGPRCHPFGSYCGVDISDWGVIQAHVGRSRYFATPTIIRAGWRLILTPTGTQAQFESHWGVSLGAETIFLNTGNFPAIDGGETYSIQAPGFITTDGPSLPMVAGDVMSRDASGWSSTAPNPGVADCPAGLTVTEVGDTADMGYGEFEYVELCVGL